MRHPGPSQGQPEWGGTGPGEGRLLVGDRGREGQAASCRPEGKSV